MGDEITVRMRQIVSRVTEEWRGLAVLALYPTVVLAFLFWSASAIDPLTAPALMLDRGLQLATLGLLPAALLILFAAERVAISALVYGAVVGFVLGMSVVLAGALRPPADYDALTLGLIASVSSAWLLVRYGRSVGWFASTGAKVAAAALAAAIPLLQFWHSTSFLPARTEASLTQSVEASLEAPDRGTLMYTATNSSNARVVVIISALYVCWRTPIEEVPAWGDLAAEAEAGTCKKHTPIGDGSWLDGGTALVWQVTLPAAPEGKPRLTVHPRIVYARGDRLRIDGSGDEQPSGACNATAFRIAEESRVKSVAQQDKHLVYYQGDQGRNYFFTAGPIPPECPVGGPPTDELGTALKKYVGVTEGNLGHQAWVDTAGSSAQSAGDS